MVTGALWAACLWLLVGDRVGDSKTMASFIAKFHLDDLPPTALFAAAILPVYLVGSLLVVRTSPFWRIEGPLRGRVSRWVERLDLDARPCRRRFRPAWRVWQRNPHRRVCMWLRQFGGGEQKFEAVDSWLHNQFAVMSADGRVPVMRSFQGGCGAPDGFLAFYSSKSVEKMPNEYFGEGGYHWTLGRAFVSEVKNEKTAVEVRIQMRYPEVYAEIDRLKVEAELRLSIFWPLIILSVLLAWMLSPFALALLVVPPLLARDAFQRIKQADAKTWSPLVAGEVSSPSLDAMKDAEKSECLDFCERFQTPTDESDADQTHAGSSDTRSVFSPS